VLHFAAKIVVPESVAQPLDYYHNNVEGVRVLLECVRDFGVKHFIFSSSAAVYGENKKGVCIETDETKPINPYGESKLACEKLIYWTARAHDFNYLIFRYFNVAGADESMRIGVKKDQLTHLIPICIQAAMGKREKLVIAGSDYDTPDGTCVRDYNHVTDVAIAHGLGAEYLEKNAESQIMNIGSKKGFSVLEVAEEVNRITAMRYEYGPRRDGDPAILVADASKIEGVLGYRPKFSLADMIRSDLAFRKKNDV
jgi:UDP-glucose 4-epimerase